MAKKKKLGPMQRQARRDVRLASQPYLNQLERAADQARDEGKEAQVRVGNIYDALQNELKPLGGQYDRKAEGIASDLTSQIGGLEGLLGISSAVAPGENAAATNLLGSIGSSGLASLASDRSRNLGYQTSTQRQAGLERASLRRNYLEDMNDILDDIRNQRLDLKSDWQSQILGRLDQLRQQRFDKEMAKKIAEREDKRFNWEKKSVNRDHRQEVKGRKVAQDILTDEQQREELQRGIGNLLDKITGVNENIGEMKSDYPGLYNKGGVWGYDNPQTGEFVPVPQFKELRQERRQLNQRVKTKRKKKRRL